MSVRQTIRFRPFHLLAIFYLLIILTGLSIHYFN